MSATVTAPDRLSARRDAVRAALALGAHAAVLVTDLVDVRWLTGFTGSYGVVLISEDACVLASDGRYEGQIAHEVTPRTQGVEVLIGRQMHLELARRAVAESRSRLLVDETVTSLAMARDLGEVEGAVLEPTRLPMRDLRMVKDPDEVDCLREACRISDQALADLLESPVIGRTEREVAIWLERRMVDLGAEAPAFDSIVASGPHSAIPHHQPDSRVIVRGDLLKIDFGARVAGYHADETRTFAVGAVEPWQAELHGVVARAQAAGVAALRAGVTLAHVDAAAREVIAEAGMGQHFTHGLGHGVGLMIHEEPFFSPSGTGILAAGVSLTVEPGVYLPGRGGVRIEDTLLVGPEGAESLTTTSRELRVLG